MKPLNFTEKNVKEPQYKDLSWDKFISLKTLLTKEKVISIPLVGVSMNPLIKEGDILKIEFLNSVQSLKRFDIIVFWQHEHLICHYFWRVNNFFHQKNNDGIEKKILATRPLNPLKGYDQPITEEHILGIVKNFQISWMLKFKILWMSL